MAILHFVPQGRYSALSRRRVTDQVLGSDTALVAIEGGPGTGKSVAAAQIADALAPENGDVVWIRISPSERETIGFWSRVFKDLFEAGVMPEGSLCERLHVGGVSSADEELLTDALSAVSAPLVVVLDDLHHVRDDISHPLLAALERNHSFRLIVTSRRALDEYTGIDARLRVPVSTLSEEFLAFTRDETAALIALRDASLTPEGVATTAAAVQRESAGWPIAVHAGIVAREEVPRGGATTPRNSFAKRYVEQLLSSSDEDQRRVLYISALLDEASTETLAQVSGLTVERITAILEDAHDAILRNWTDEDGVRWYRHHDLIRDELRKRVKRELGSAELRRIYHDSAVALARVRPRAAVTAALHGQSWDLLCELITGDLARNTSIEQREEKGPRLRDIPKSVRERYPILGAFALIDEFTRPCGRTGRVITEFKAFSRWTLGEETLRPGLRGMTASTLRMIAARMSGNEQLSLEMASRSIQTFEELDDAEAKRFRASLPVVTTQTAVTLLCAEKFDDAEEVLLRNLDGGEDMLSHGVAHALALTTLSAAWRGHVPRAKDLLAKCRELELPLGWRNAHIGAGYRLASAHVQLELGDTDGAAEHLEMLADREPTAAHWAYLVHMDTLLTESRDGQTEALARLDWHLARRKDGLAALPTATRSLQELRARIAWQTGRLSTRQPRDLSGIVPILAAFNVGRLETARTLAASMLKEPQLLGFPRRRAAVQLLLAEAYRREGDHDAAQTAGKLAAKLLQEFGMTLPLRFIPREDLRSLAELVPDLQHELGGSGSAAHITPLTKSELRALTAVAVHGTVPRAAAALFLSENTVKSQVRATYRKFGTNSRDQAIRVASAAGLLDLSTLGQQRLAH